MQKCHICSSPPGTWEHGSLSLGSRLRNFHWRSRGLRIATQGRPPRLMCGANRVSLSPMQIMAIQPCGCFSVEWIARCGTSRPARPGASLTSLPAPGTYLRAEYSIVKVQAVLLHKGKIMKDALYDFLIRLRYQFHNTIKKISLNRSKPSFSRAIPFYKADTTVVAPSCCFNRVCNR